MNPCGAYGEPRRGGFGPRFDSPRVPLRDTAFHMKE